LTDRLTFASLGMVVAPLSFFYFYYLAWTIKSGAILSASAIDAVVLAAMIARLAAVMAIPRLRRAKASIIVDIFSVEVLITASLIIFYIVLGERTYPALLTGIALAWLPALLLVVPPYAIYRFAVGMTESSKLAVVVPFGVGLFSMLVVPCEVATLSSGAQGLSGVSRLLLSVFIGQARYGYLLTEVTVAGLLLYVALVLHVISRQELGENRQYLLLLAVLGSTITLAWSAIGSALTNDTLLLFTVPGLAMLGAIWWSTRGH
jgi:hypothetical protein